MRIEISVMIDLGMLKSPEVVLVFIFSA